MKQLRTKFEDTEKVFPVSRLLCLVRHGEAAPKDIGLDDFERSLTNKGVKTTEKVAKAVTKKIKQFDLLLSSPADRALETAHLFAYHWHYPVQKIKIVNELYGSSISVVTNSLNTWLVNEHHTIALFGHNPQFNQLAAFFVPDFDVNIPKSAAVAIRCEASSWNELHAGTGHLDFFITPERIKFENAPGHVISPQSRLH